MIAATATVWAADESARPCTGHGSRRIAGPPNGR